MSDDFQRFLKSNFFGNPFYALHDGVDISALTRLQADELVQAEDMLLKNLPDNRAIIGLGAIRSQKAVVPLRKLLDAPGQATDAAVALFKINGDTSGIDPVIKQLQNQHSFWSSRMDAAIALRNFRTGKVVNALLSALDDPEKLVRHHAAQSLLVMYGAREQKGEFNRSSLAMRIMRTDERAAAAAELRQIVKDGQLTDT